jgi:hypothetical protein
MNGISPNFADWRRLSAIQIWELAALMHGFDPRAMADVTVRDPYDPESLHGVSLDTSWEVRMLVSAVLAADLISSPAQATAADGHTQVNVESAISWLATQGYAELSKALSPLHGNPNRASAPAAWSLNKPKRFGGYAKPLYTFLESAHMAGEQRPSARQVVAAFKLDRPDEIAQTLLDGFDYYDAKGNTKGANLAAITEAIRRRTR